MENLAPEELGAVHCVGDQDVHSVGVWDVHCMRVWGVHCVGVRSLFAGERNPLPTP